MKIEDMKLEDVIARLVELDGIVERSEVVKEIEDATTEKQELLNRKVLLEDLKERKQIAKDLEAGKIEADNIFEERGDDKKMENKEMNATEYRNAWLRNLQGGKLTEIETRAFTGGSAVVPEETANMIIDKLVDFVPLLNEVELLRVKGNVKFAVQTAAPAPSLKKGGLKNDEATTTLTEVSLGSWTISTFVRIGADLASMAISAFEGWLTDKISEQLAYKIENYIINGAGTSEPTGIDKITWVADTNAKAWTGTGSILATKDIDGAIGLLPAAYDRNSKFLTSKKSFFADVIGLADINNVPLVQRENNKYMIRGYDVIFSDQVAADTMYFGDFKRGVVANLSNEVAIERGRNLEYNAYDYLGWCSFDSKPSGVASIVKITKTIA